MEGPAGAKGLWWKRRGRDLRKASMREQGENETRHNLRPPKARGGF